MTDTTIIQEQLRALARAEHDDLSIAADAADVIKRLTEIVEAQRQDIERLLSSRLPDMKPPPEYPSLVYRLVRMLYDGHRERDFKNTEINLCNMEDYTVSIGPHPGFDDDYNLSLEIKECRGPLHSIVFKFDDDLPARQIAAALIAWADWTEKVRETEANPEQQL